MRKQVQYSPNKGMNKDLSISKYTPEFVYDTYNMRLNSNEDNTLYTLTNAKGNIQLSLVKENPQDDSYSNIIEGTVIGHDTVGDYIVLFTTTRNTTFPLIGKTLPPNGIDRIYRLTKTTDYNGITNFNVYIKQLFKGVNAASLNFSKDSLIETIAYFESNEVQKVYWVDKNNQPRFLNIVSERLNEPLTVIDNYGNTIPNPRLLTNQSFDFSSNLDLKENITIIKNPSGGQFHSGCIQYLFLYWNLNGNQSKIFHTTPIYYVSSQNRANGPDETSNCSFTIGINNLDKKFDYLRIYSLQWTTQDSIGSSRIVMDIDISKLASDANNTNGISRFNGYTFNDNGIIGSSIDYNILNYVGSKELIIGTLAHKDNTLFLGNITLKTPSVKDIQNTILNNPFDIILSKKSVNLYFKTSDTIDDSNTYFYKPYTLNYNSQLEPITIKHWKKGETYRWGIQAQYKNGEWSDPIYLGKDVSINIGYETELISGGNDNNDVRGITGNKIKFVTGTIDLTGNITLNTGQTITRQAYWESIVSALLNLGFVKIRPIYVPLTMANRKVLSQGILTSTIAKTNNRKSNSPFATPNWFTRGHSEFVRNISSDLTNIDYHITKGPLLSVPFTRVDIGLNQGPTFSDNWYMPNSIRNQFNYNSSYLNNYILYNSYYRETAGTDASGFFNYSNHYIPNSYLSTNIRPELDPNSWDKDDNRLKQWFSDTNLLSFWSPETAFNYLDNIDLSLVNTIQFRGIANITNSTSAYKELESDNSNNSDFSPYYFTPYSNSIVTRTGFSSDAWGVWDSNVVFDKRTYKYKIYSKYSVSTYNNMFLDNISLSYSINAPKVIDPTVANSQYKTNFTDFNGVINYQSQVEELNVSDDNTYSVIFNSNKHAILSLISKTGVTPLGVDILPEFRIDNSKTEDTFHIWYQTGIVNNSVHINYLDPSTYLGKSFEEMASMAIVNSGTMAYSGYPYLWIVDITRNISNQYGSKTIEDLTNNKWIPCGNTVELSNNASTIVFDQGDTFIQRYDCLRIVPKSTDLSVQWQRLTDGVTVWLESFINLDGRYDTHRYDTDLSSLGLNNFNINNGVYSQSNNFFEYNILNYKLLVSDSLPNTFMWTDNKVAGASTDVWTTLKLSTNTYTVDGELGKINFIDNFKNELFGFQDNGIFQILYNSRVQVPTSSGAAIELTQSWTTQGIRYLSKYVGCNNKWTIKQSNKTLYFVDALNKGFYMFNEPPTDLSEKSGFKAWFYNNTVNYKEYNLLDNNTAFSVNVDFVNDNIYVNNRDFSLMYSERLDQFESFYSYENTPFMLNIWGEFLAVKSTNDISSIWACHKGNYNSFFGTTRPSRVEFYVNPDMPVDKVFDNFQYRADVFDTSGVYIPKDTFDTVQVTNEFQNVTKSLKTTTSTPDFKSKKFRIWSFPFPRESNSLNRIRNPWVKMTFTYNNENLRKLMFHDLVITYNV